ncbi:MAG: hypothetical protein AAFQ22_13780 [Pseudomonadota bacterium]
MWIKLCLALVASVLLMVGVGSKAAAQRVTNTLEYHVLENAGYAWTPVSYVNSYTNPVIVCTYVLPSSTSPPAVVRVDPNAADSFRVRVQQFEDSSVVTPSTVFCIVSETGVFTLPGGLKYEALTVLSDQTSGRSVGWQQSRLEALSLSTSFTTPIVLGQVMSFNDNRASVFHATDCERRQNRPYQSGFSDGACVGKHIGSISGSRATETLGVIVVETGTSSGDNIATLAGRTGNNLRGIGNSPPYSNNVVGDFDLGVASMAGENGGDGGWFVFFGSDPLPNGQVRGGIDEETVALDTSRTHIDEEAFYWLFDDNNQPELTLDKTAPTTVFDRAGETITFSYDIENTGNTPLTGITLDDDQIGAVYCPQATLAIGADMTCSADYTITLADVTAGSVTNIATADGETFYGTLQPATDSWTLGFSAAPSDLDVEKSVQLYDPMTYFLPGEDVIYSLKVTNRGSTSPDEGSLFLVDAMPDEVIFFTGDMDDGGPASGPVFFEETGTALTVDPMTDIGLSNSPTRPMDMSACNYYPAFGVYDPQVTFVCVRPQGTMPGNSPDPSFTVSFRARLK